MSNLKVATPLTSLTMVKAAKMQLIRELVSECLSAAAEEIFKIVERTVIEYEEEFSCSKWVVDDHHRLLGVSKSDRADAQQPPVSVDVGVKWEEPEKTESTEACCTLADRDPRFSPAASKSYESDQVILIDIEDDDDMRKNLSVLKSLKESATVTQRRIKVHPESKSLSYQCQSCDRFFCHESDLIVHTRTHTDMKPYSCHACQKGFAQKSGLVLHRRQHLGEKPYEHALHAEKRPTDMEQEETRFQGLESNMKALPLSVAPYDKNQIKTEPEEPEATSDGQLLPAARPRCSVSADEQSDSEKEMMVRHQWSELKRLGKSSEPNEAGTAQKPYKCPHCSKRFSLTKTLIRHVKIHTENKSYHCQFCERNFCQKSDLVNHMRTHTGEKPYQCHVCHKSFSQKGNLGVHVRKHYQRQKYKSCFSQKAYLDHQYSAKIQEGPVTQ
ncbi:hypothetical protein LDENG_00189240 [Lucifuga dentata]|nr:hypothetical protein LDENG_00189240 [Lucifuga dentata]